ncbi:hypothetical protein [Cytobacillus massiliigabonensis]|uniref:hypothetical protein n=1 Tax=Cytobacillus massiliigabonensis TaxID=1871011 RepID=UPI000C853EF7|nr:hypothetical protein [Cytobacillus massiliigabonensis]
MTLVEAIRALTNGASAAVSAIGKRYTAAELAPINFIGKHAVSYRDVGMTEAERKGEWRVE